MDIRKCAPVYVSGILTAIAFIALVFIPVGGVSILEALISATELTTAGFVCFGLFAIAHMVVVAAAAICCAAIAVSGMRKRKSAEDLARRTVNAIAVIVLLIGMLSVAQTSIVSFIASGYGSETMAFAFYPSVWVCFGIGMSALLVCFICGMSACPPGLPLNDVPRRLFSVFLAVTAFVLACALNNIIHINNTIVEIAAMAFRVLLLSGTFLTMREGGQAELPDGKRRQFIARQNQQGVGIRRFLREKAVGLQRRKAERKRPGVTQLSQHLRQRSPAAEQLKAVQLV